jgi:hypothetical protein
LNGVVEANIDPGWTKCEKELIQKTGVRILHEKCDKEMAESKNLPLNSYLVTYEINDVVLYDIVQSHGQVKVFDAYYDKFGVGVLKSMKWTKGTINPKLYGATKPDAPKKRSR